jgi:hypothetical protein
MHLCEIYPALAWLRQRARKLVHVTCCFALRCLYGMKRFRSTLLHSMSDVTLLGLDERRNYSITTGQHNGVSDRLRRECQEAIDEDSIRSSDIQGLGLGLPHGTRFIKGILFVKELEFLAR